MYTMEMKYILTGKLNFVNGGLGPVEVELIIAIIFIAASIFGSVSNSDTMQEMESNTFVLANTINLKEIDIKLCITVLIILLQLLFSLQNLVDCFKTDIKRSL